MKKALPNTKVTVKLRRIVPSVQTWLKQSKPCGGVNQPDYIHTHLGQVIHRTNSAGWQFQLQAEEGFERNYSMPFHNRPGGLYLCR